MAHSHSQYKYRLVAFVHPEVTVARPFLSFLGWEVLEKPVPVEISQVSRSTILLYATCWVRWVTVSIWVLLTASVASAAV